VLLKDVESQSHKMSFDQRAELMQKGNLRSQLWACGVWTCKPTPNFKIILWYVKWYGIKCSAIILRRNVLFIICFPFPQMLVPFTYELIFGSRLRRFSPSFFWKIPSEVSQAGYTRQHKRAMVDDILPMFQTTPSIFKYFLFNFLPNLTTRLI
jgi:hypothetical protein